MLLHWLTARFPIHVKRRACQLIVLVNMAFRAGRALLIVPVAARLCVTCIEVLLDTSEILVTVGCIWGVIRWQRMGLHSDLRLGHLS